MKKNFFLFILLMVSAATSAQEPTLVLPVSHNNFIKQVALSDDYKYIISYGGGSDFFLSETATGRLLKTFTPALSSSIVNVTFSPNSKYVMSISNNQNKNVIVWDILTGRKILESYYFLLSGRDSFAESWPFFSGDSKFLLTQDIEGNVEIFNVETCQMSYSFKVSASRKVWLRNGKLFMLDGYYIHEWDYLNDKPISTVKLSKQPDKDSVDLNIRIDNKIISQYAGDSIYVYNPFSGEEILRLGKVQNFRFDLDTTKNMLSWQQYDKETKRDLVHFYNGNTKQELIYKLNQSHQQFIAEKAESNYSGSIYKTGYLSCGDSFLDYSFVKYHSDEKIQTILSKRKIGTGEVEWTFKADFPIRFFRITPSKVICSSISTDYDEPYVNLSLALDLQTGKKIALVKGLMESDDQITVVIDNVRHQITISDQKSGAPPIVIAGKEFKLNKKIFFINNNLLFSGNKLIDINTGRVQYRFAGHFLDYDEKSRILLMKDSLKANTLYNLNSYQKIAKIEGEYLQMDGREMLITHSNEKVNLVNYLSGKILKSINGTFRESVIDDKTKEYSYILIEDKQGLKIYNCKKQMIYQCKGQFEEISRSQLNVITKDNEIEYMYLLNDGKLITQGTDLRLDSVFKKTGKSALNDGYYTTRDKILVNRTLSVDRNYTMDIFPNDSAIISSLKDNHWSKKIKLRLPPKEDRIFARLISSFIISNDRKLIYTTDDWDHYIIGLDDSKATKLNEIEQENYLFGRFSKNSKFFFSKSGRKTLNYDLNITESIWDLSTGKRLAHYSGYGRDSLAFSNDLEYCAFYNGNYIELFNSEKAKFLYQYLDMDSVNYLITDKNSHYDGPQEARKLVYFVCGKEIIDLDQVKDQLWVPNLAERIMKGDSINAKKISDLDICGLSPEVEKLEKPGYNFRITPHRGGLGETILFINGIEIKRYTPSELTKVPGGFELNLKEQDLQPYLVSGKLNPITVKSYTSVHDIGSRIARALKDETSKAAVIPNLYAIMIGVSDYKDPELRLSYAAKDAVDMSKALASSARKLLNTDGKDHVFMYNLTTNNERDFLPEKAAIKNLFSMIGKSATANDILLVFFAGHGVVSGDVKQFYFLTADASLKTFDASVSDVGISTKELSEWMNPVNIKAQKRILILDACNTGKVINELVGSDAAKDYIVARNDDKSAQIKAIDKLNERSGIFIIAAAASNQSAYEMEKYSQGILTYSLLKAIKQQPDILEDGNLLNVGLWFNAAEKTVSDVARQTGRRQEPQLISAGNFNIGMVDQSVRSAIVLSEEKLTFGPSNFQNDNEKVLADDLGLNRLIDDELRVLSSSNEKNAVNFIPSNFSDENYLLSGRYNISSGAIHIRINVRRNQNTIFHYEINGKKQNLKILSSQIVKEALMKIALVHQN